MVCDEVRAAVSAALDGEAEVDAAHLTTCADCARFERAARRLRSALRFEVVDAPPDVTGRVLAAVAASPARPAEPGRRCPARGGVARRRPHRRRTRAAARANRVASLSRS